MSGLSILYFVNIITCQKIVFFLYFKDYHHIQTGTSLPMVSNANFLPAKIAHRGISGQNLKNEMCEK